MPDFSAMSEDDLMSFWKRYHRPTRSDASEIVGDKRAGYTNVAARLACYACNLAVALRCRARGDEQTAVCYDHAARITFENLPADVRARIKP